MNDEANRTEELARLKDAIVNLIMPKASMGDLVRLLVKDLGMSKAKVKALVRVAVERHNCELRQIMDRNVKGLADFDKEIDDTDTGSRR